MYIALHDHPHHRYPSAVVVKKVIGPLRDIHHAMEEIVARGLNPRSFTLIRELPEHYPAIVSAEWR